MKRRRQENVGAFSTWKGAFGGIRMDGFREDALSLLFPSPKTNSFHAWEIVKTLSLGLS